MDIKIGMKITPWYTVTKKYDIGPYAFIEVKCKCKRTVRNYALGTLKQGKGLMCNKCYAEYRNALYAPLRKIRESIIKQFKKRK